MNSVKRFILSIAASFVLFSFQGGTPNWQNHNAIFDYICVAQGADVAPGSPAALAWGTPPYSGTTGGHVTYGYRHLHKYMELTGDERVNAVRATFASALARHVAYTGPGAAIRSGGYEKGQRPLAWNTPELPNDLPGGATRWNYNGVDFDYTGLDEEHAWSFLFDLIHLQGVTVPLFPGVPGLEWIDATQLARARLSIETSGVVGMASQPYYLQFHTGPNTMSDRVYGRLLDWIVRSSAQGCLMAEDADRALTFVKATSYFYTHAPGVTTLTKALACVPPVNPDTPYFTTPFVAWAAAALYDAYIAVGPSDPALSAQLRTASMRLGRWIAESVVGNSLPWAVSLAPDVLAGIGGQPVPSLTPYFANGHAVRHDTGTDAGAWAYRALRCAAALGEPTAAYVAPKILAKWQNDHSMWPFLVNEDWSYAVAGAKNVVGE